MEPCLELLEQLRKEFDLDEPDIREFSPLSLAYIGDAVYELVVRTVAFHRINAQVGKINKLGAKYVSAKAQARIVRLLFPELTKEEADVFRKGKNAKPISVAKHQTISDYHRATGFEAMIGYLFLNRRWDRIVQLIHLGITRYDAKESR